ncbi:MAG TPA: 2-phosphosulfolactate phosphatase [Clostridia bacterium]|nr:2-phosphosulfolactate phosphatase [Clostridia bacterium]
MKIDTIPLYSKIPVNQLSGCTVIVVDVLRASSSIITAVMNGAQKIVPASDPGEAAALALRLGVRDCVLAGERGGLRLPDFSLGNSPAEFTAEAVGGKQVIISTTNGTEAINSVKNAKNVLIGGMINRTAVARRALEFEDDILIVCAGTQGRISADDLCAAGAIAEAMNGVAGQPLTPTDFTMVCCMLYADWREGRADLSVTDHYSRLVRLGFEDDVKYCFTQDITDVVPVYNGGVIS